MTEKSGSVVRSSEFGYDPAKIWYRQKQHLQTIDGMYRGIQAIVTFEGTSYQDAFDKALKELKEFADKGTGNYGWRSDEDKSKWGQFNEVELPNHHKYRVVDRTEEGDKGITLSIEDEESCSYRFTGKGKYNVRAIDISDARTEMKSVNQVMEEIKAIVKTVSEN